MTTTTSTQLPTNARDITAGHVAQALRATGHDAQVEYQGHGITEVHVPLDADRRILVHSYTGGADPQAARIDTYDGWPAVAIATNDGACDDEMLCLDRDAPDVPQLYDSLTVADLLAFTVAAVAELKARR